MTNNEIEPALLKPKNKVSVIWLLPLVTLMIGAGFATPCMAKPWRTNPDPISNSRRVRSEKKPKLGFVVLKLDEYKRSILPMTTSLLWRMLKSNENMMKLLSEDTEFWIVRPRIGSEGVSGIGTIFSGAYIQLEPGKSQEDYRILCRARETAINFTNDRWY